jgi:hypothetical protein
MPFDGLEFAHTDFARSDVADVAAPRTPSLGRLRALFAPRKREEARVASPSPAHGEALLVLQTAREMIEPARYWVQGTYRTMRGRHCAVGALNEAARRLDASAGLPLARERLLAVARSRGFARTEDMNDCSAHAQVLSAFDEAIAAVRRDSVRAG